jgi:hypothetical protein
MEEKIMSIEEPRPHSVENIRGGRCDQNLARLRESLQFYETCINPPFDKAEEINALLHGNREYLFNLILKLYSPLFFLEEFDSAADARDLVDRIIPGKIIQESDAVKHLNRILDVPALAELTTIFEQAEEARKAFTEAIEEMDTKSFFSSSEPGGRGKMRSLVRKKLELLYAGTPQVDDRVIEEQDSPLRIILCKSRYVQGIWKQYEERMKYWRGLPSTDEELASLETSVKKFDVITEGVLYACREIARQEYPCDNEGVMSTIAIIAKTASINKGSN